MVKKKIENLIDRTFLPFKILEYLTDVNQLRNSYIVIVIERKLLRITWNEYRYIF